MKRSITAIACACVLLPCAQVHATSWNTVIFRHDFDSSVDGMPDPEVWVINYPGEWWWTQGRTHFPNPDPWLPNGEFPRVEDDVCIIEHHLYNRYDLGDPNEWFLGGEIRTVMKFDPTIPYRFEARVRCYSDRCHSEPCVPYPNGLVTSFFVYGYDGSNSDEIDFEYLSSMTNDDANYPDGDPVLTNTWNESHQWPECVETDGLDLTQWNTFRIYWYPGLRRVLWAWLDPINGETCLRTETADSCVPDEPMALYFNFWAPPGPWEQPCDPYEPTLQPVNDPDQNEICGYEIDWVEVRVPTCTWYRDADGDGCGDPNESIEDCEQPAGYVADSTDCDDGDAQVNPGATDLCGMDRNCDGVAPQPLMWYGDADGDGYGDPNESIEDCEQPENYVADNTDCDDSDANVNPGATEICDDRIDNDCDGLADMGDDDCVCAAASITLYTITLVGLMRSRRRGA